MDLNNMTEDQVKEILEQSKKKLNEFAEQKLQARRSLNRSKLEFYRENKDIILSLIEHGRTSCSDSNLANGYSFSSGNARCNKCYLIEVLEGHWGDEVEVTFRVDLERISE